MLAGRAGPSWVEASQRLTSLHSPQRCGKSMQLLTYNEYCFVASIPECVVVGIGIGIGPGGQYTSIDHG
jgi:hypothetical protein